MVAIDHGSLGGSNRNTGSRGAALSHPTEGRLRAQGKVPLLSCGSPRTHLGLKGAGPGLIPLPAAVWGGSTFPIPDPLPGMLAPQVLLYLQVRVASSGRPSMTTLFKIASLPPHPSPLHHFLALIAMCFINLPCLLSVSHQQTRSSTRAGICISFVHY